MFDRERLLHVVLPVLVVALAGLIGSASLGYMFSRLEVRGLRAEREALRLSREELLAQLPEGAAMAADVEAAETAEEPASAPPTVDPAELEALKGSLQAALDEKKKLAARLAKANGVNDKLGAKSAETSAKNSQLAEKLGRLDSKNARLAKEVAALQKQLMQPAVASKPGGPSQPPASAPRPAKRVPDVSASRPPKRAAAECPALEQPDYVFESTGETHSRLGGRLELRLLTSGDGLALQLGKGARHRLSDVPKHISWSCGGTDYIVSACKAEPDPVHVTGTIRAAEGRWRDPCKKRG